MAFIKPIVNKNSGHRPIDSSDRLTPESIPVSENAGNQLVTAGDGMYVGILNSTPVKIYVDASTGVDDTGRGSLGSPVKTLDYALAALDSRDLSGNGFSRIGAVYDVMLKVGQSFTLGQSVEMSGVTIRLGFYGDSRGDWETQVGTTALEVLTDVNLPKITNAFAVNSTTGLTEASRFYSKNQRWPSSLELHGVQVNLAETSSANLGVVDFVDGVSLDLVGSVINKNGLGPSGLMAIRSSQHLAVRQFASQFTIAGRPIDKAQGQGDITFADLEARALFFKFYLGLGSSNYQWDRLVYNPQATNSSNASGLLDLLWEDTISQPAGSSTTRSSYPHMSDLNYGVAQYFTGLRRDQLGRSLNVLAGRII